MAFPERTAHEFFEQVSVQIGDETHMFRRLRILGDGACPVFEHGDLEKTVRLRVEDISRDANGVGWLHCCCLFSKGQLPPHIAGALPSGLDAQRELDESIDAVQGPAAEVIGVSRVISTSAWRSLSPSDRSGVCHHEAAFAEEDGNVSKWKVAHAKQRERNGASAPVGHRRRH